MSERNTQTGAPAQRLRRHARPLAAGAMLLTLAATAAAGYLSGQRHATPADTFAAVQAGHLARLDRSAQPGHVVFLGSSTFQALDTAAITPTALNLSIGGDTTADLLDRARSYRSLASATAVWLNIGFNDMMQRCASPRGSLPQVFDLVPAGTPLFVLAIQNVSAERLLQRCDGRLSALIDTYNGELATACAARPACQFVPHPANAHLGSARHASWIESDGIHLSPTGYAALIDTMRGVLHAAAPSLVSP